MDARCNNIGTDEEPPGDDLQLAQRVALPYPHHLAAEHRLPDGIRLRTRPIAPQDRRRPSLFLCSLSLQTRYQRLMSQRSAIVVADAWQHRGIGSMLLLRLRQIAQDAGIERLAGLTLAPTGA